MFEVIKTEGTARRGRFRCAHGGEVQTPVFMNVGTQGAIKGGIDAFDLKELGCQIELSNTYHLHLRPGDDVVRQMGGLHRFMRWDGPILTDSGGFQVFSLAGLRKITEEGVTFASHLDGHRIFMGPEESMQIQSHLGSDIAMAFDECVENPARYDYAKASCERTLRWLERCKAEHDRLATAVLVTDSAAFAQAVAGELERQIPLLPRAEIARASIDGSGKIIVAENDLKKAIEIANELAPEHLELCVDNPFDYLDQIRCAGSVFLGKNCPEALGDYFAGPNHTLPTCGTARFSSPLSVDDFLKKSSVFDYVR